MTKAYKIELYGVLIFPVICVLLLSYPSWREFLGSFEVPTNMDDMMDSVLFYLLLIVFAEAFLSALQLINIWEFPLSVYRLYRFLMLSFGIIVVVFVFSFDTHLEENIVRLFIIALCSLYNIFYFIRFFKESNAVYRYRNKDEILDHLIEI